MLKYLEKISRKESIDYFIKNSSFAIWNAKNDRTKYEQYKLKELTEMGEYDKLNIDILSILDSLGFSMDELGTYLYKDLIIEIYGEIKDISYNRNDAEKCRDLLKSLDDASSNFYSWIARDDKEMSVTAFHSCIEQAIAKINAKAIDIGLLAKISGINPVEMNYGVFAFQIASYYANKYKATCEKPVIKNLNK